MDPVLELYYRSEEDYWKEQNKVLPYMVNCEDIKRCGLLTTPLKEAGFTYIVPGSGMPNRMAHFLVNLEFKKFYKMPYPVGSSCVNNRTYSVEEFIEEVLNPYLEQERNGQ